MNEILCFLWRQSKRFQWGEILVVCKPPLRDNTILAWNFPPGNLIRGVNSILFFISLFFVCVINLMESLTRGCQFSFIFHFPFFVINLTSIEQNLTASVVKANFQGRHLAGDRLPSGCWFDPLIHVECLRVSYWSVGGGKASMH